MEWLYHGLTGNDAAEGQVGATRGVVLGALLGLLNAVVMFLPIDAEQKVELLVALNPPIGLLSYVVFAYFDKWLRRIGRKG